MVTEKANVFLGYESYDGLLEIDTDDFVDLGDYFVFRND